LKGYIPDIKVEEVKNRASIVDLVSEYVTLKKAGRNFVGLCPFHKEKTPSFTVTPDRQMFYCFGCGEGGNVFAFLMKISQMTYPEAIRHLAKKTGVIIPERISQKERQEASQQEQLIRINEMAADHYARNLATSSGKEAVAYLEQRGVREEVVREFRLGFALNSWRHLRDFFEKEKASLANAEQAGLLIPGKDASPYDRFRGRLMFPVEDFNGRVIAFGGRLIGDGEPKYLNSPESAVYVKGRNLYGLNRAKEAIRRQGCVIVVEGYFDLISLWNAGITHVVATLGTALTKEQIDLIGRYTTQVVALFDPDEAGRKALTRSLELFLAGNLSARALVLPEGLDPDDYVRAYGGDRLLELINGAPSLVDYYIDHVLGDQGGFEKDRDSFRKAVAFIKHIENVVDRNLFIKRVSEKLGIDQDLLKKEIVKKTRARIMMGGRTIGFKGKYPGLVEEALLTLQAKKPLFLLGGYGGASQAICQALQGQQPETLTKSYQCRNESYKTLLQEFNQRIAEQQLDQAPIDYQALVKSFAEIGINGLNNGLTDQENRVLFTTINAEEAIGLILTGLARIKLT